MVSAIVRSVDLKALDVPALSAQFLGLLAEYITPLPCYGESAKFSEGNINHNGKRTDLARARILCSACPLQEPCAAFACEQRERGVWGGTTGRERADAGYPPRRMRFVGNG